MLCSHSLKVLVQKDYQKLPEKNILKRWTLWARQTNSDHVACATTNLAHATSESYRRNALYLAAMDLYKEGLTSEDTFGIAMEAINTANAGILSMKKTEVPSSCTKEPEISVMVDRGQQILAPERKITKGRTCTVRPKSRMDYVVAKKIKDAKLSKLCGHGKGADCDDDSCQILPQPSKTRLTRCSNCRATGHNRSKCTKKGM